MGRGARDGTTKKALTSQNTLLMLVLKTTTIVATPRLIGMIDHIVSLKRGMARVCVTYPIAFLRNQVVLPPLLKLIPPASWVRIYKLPVQWFSVSLIPQTPMIPWRLFVEKFSLTVGAHSKYGIVSLVVRDVKVTFPMPQL